MFKRRREELYGRAKLQKLQAMEALEVVEGSLYHDWCAVVNIMDELAAQLYRVKDVARLKKKVGLARRMATLIGDGKLRAAVMVELQKYEIN